MPKAIKHPGVNDLGFIHPKSYVPTVGDRWWVHRLAGIKKLTNLHYHNKLGIKVTIRLSSKLEDQGRNQASKCELFGSS